MADYFPLIQKYFPREQWQNARRVMQAESGGDPRAHNTNGEDSRGLFQINVGPGANTQLAKYNLFDPETNVRLAAEKWQGEGWRPWTTAVQMGIAGGGGQPGGTQMAGPILPKTVTAVELEQIAKAHGGHKSQIVATQSTKDIASGAAAKVTFVFNDGTSLDATWNQDAGSWVVNDWATAGKTAQRDDTEVIRDPETGQRIGVRVGGTLVRDPEPTDKTPVVRQFPDGSLRQWNGQDWTVIGQAPAELAKPQFTSHGGQLYRVGPDGTLTVAIPQTPEEQQAARLAIQKEQLQIAKLRQGMVPPAQLLLQQQFESINQLQGMLERNEITPAEAETYMGQIKAQTQAALAGTTIFQQQQAEREYEQARRSTGANLLNTRLTTGAGMAQSLLSGALGAYGKLYPGTGAPPMMDPLAMAQAFTMQMGGGQEVSDFAKSMLLGAGGGPGAPGAGQFPSTREAVLAMYPELAGGQPMAAPVAPIGPAAPAPAMPAPGPVPPAPIPSPPYPLPAARSIPRVA